MRIKSDVSQAGNIDVIIIGAGFSGLGAAIKLKNEGVPFIILEQAHDLGGTWRDNSYPGIAVDIASFTYSYSFEQNPDWSRIFAPGAELKKYADDCAEKYKLTKSILFNHKVLEAQYIPKTKNWKISCENGKIFICRVLITATGALTQPKFPDISGLKSFKGKLIHTARWDHTLDLAEKKVAVIGTGATSVQLVPAIANKVRRLTVYQRTPIWIFPKPDAEIPYCLRRLFSENPILQWSARLFSSSITEMVMVLGVVYYKQFPILANLLEEICRKHLEISVNDPDVRAKLIPEYGFGCKRPSFSNDYWSTFNKKNIFLETDSIEQITERGIKTKSGNEEEYDIIIAATGFKVFEFGNTPPFPLYGKNKKELGSFFHENRYQAYQGISIPDFPNHFMMVGPYSAAGASWFQLIETQCAHFIRCLREMKKRNSLEIEIKVAAHRNYFDNILKRQQNTLFYNSNCSTANSYYFDRHGDAPFLRPMSYLETWLHTRFFPLEDYNFN